MSTQPAQDHHHHNSPIDDAVSQAVAKAITHPAMVQSIMSGVHEQNAMASLSNCERMRPVHPSEALVPPLAYNDRGDALLLLRRRMFFAETTNVIVTFTQGADGSVEFSAIMYADHFNDTLQTKFIEFNDPALMEEFNRQIAEFYTVELAGKSIQVVMLICQGLMRKNIPAETLAPEEVPLEVQAPAADKAPAAIPRF